jgi:hypothetical protein
VVLGNAVKEVDYHFAYRTITFCGRTFQNTSAMVSICNFPANLCICPAAPHNPVCTTHTGLTYRRFGLFPVRSPLLRESRLLSFPGATEMVQFAPLASPRLWIHLGMMQHDPHQVAPFGNPRIKGYLHLPEAYRSLSRPSSPSCAKASTVRPL